MHTLLHEAWVARRTLPLPRYFPRTENSMLAILIPLVSVFQLATAAPESRAGRTFLAYPGETIRLDGSTSKGIEPDFRWVQIGGPRVPLTGADTARPEFYADLPGRYTFELTVREGDNASAPDEVDVVVLDPEVGTRYVQPSGCSTLSPVVQSISAWMLVPLTVCCVLRRRGNTPT